MELSLEDNDKLMSETFSSKIQDDHHVKHQVPVIVLQGNNDSVYNQRLNRKLHVVTLIGSELGSFV